MINANQKFIQQVLSALHRGRLQQKRDAMREKVARERAQGNLELFMDDLVQEGIDPMSPLGKFLMAAYVARAVQRSEEPGPPQEEVW